MVGSCEKNGQHQNRRYLVNFPKEKGTKAIKIQRCLYGMVKYFSNDSGCLEKMAGDRVLWRCTINRSTREFEKAER